MAFDDVRRRAQQRVADAVAIQQPVSPSSEYLADYARIEPLIRRFGTALRRRHSPENLRRRFRGERRRKFRERRDPSHDDRIESFISSHALQSTEAVTVAVVMRGELVSIDVRYQNIGVVVSLLADSWRCDYYEAWWDGCRIGKSCWRSRGHSHGFLTNRPEAEELARYIHSNLVGRNWCGQAVDFIEEAMALAAPLLGIPDTELEG